MLTDCSSMLIGVSAQVRWTWCGGESEQRMVSTDQLRSYSTILTRTSGLKPHSRSMKRRGALQRGPRVAEAFKGVADTDASDYVRDAALEYLRKFAQPSR